MTSVQGASHEQRRALPPVELSLRDSECIGDVSKGASKRAHTEETSSNGLRPHTVEGVVSM